MSEFLFNLKNTYKSSPPLPKKTKLLKKETGHFYSLITWNLFFFYKVLKVMVEIHSLITMSQIPPDQNSIANRKVNKLFEAAH